MLKVTITPSGSPAVVLCDGPMLGEGSALGPSGLEINGERLRDERQIVRAAQRSFKDRANLKSTITFTVSREHSTITTAWAFAFTHYGDLPGQGSVLFEMGEEGGGVVRKELPDATLSITRHLVEGVRTRHWYTIEGGATQVPSS